MTLFKKSGVTALDTNVLPHQFVISENVTIDYLDSANSLEQVFSKHFRAPSIREFDVDRQKLVNKLLSYNQKRDAPQQVIQNIDSLSQRETYAVMTGQQPGVFSGPLYTVYKAISAIVLCEKMSNRKHSFVPIFWNASEDHDLSEIDHVGIFRQNEPLEIRYNYRSRRVAFSHMTLDKSELKKMLEIIEDVSPDSEFKAPLLREIDEIIQRSSTISDFFSRFMLYLFGELGLILVEPQPLRDLLTPVFEKLIRDPTECTRILNEEGFRLERLGYSPKIHKKSDLCNFFVLNKEGKRLPVKYNGKFQITDKTYSETELIRLLYADPSKFSANAVTRPIIQDFLFPTFAYVAGPNEIAYQAQLRGIYDFFGLEMPVIFPRFGATIVEKKVSKIISKYEIGIPELREPEKVMKKLVKENIDDIFDSFRNEVSRGVGEVTRQAESIDETLIRSCFLARGRIFKTIDALEDKIAAKLKNQDSVMRQQVAKAHNNLFPYGDLQERKINVLEYLMKFGKGFLTVIEKKFSETDYGEHAVIYC